MSTHGTALAPDISIPSNRFDPFYCRVLRRWPGDLRAVQALLALSLGLVFLVAHAITTRGAAFKNFSWMVALIISAAMFLLYYATSVLIEVMAEADLSVSPAAQRVYNDAVVFWLSDGKFLAAGTVFGLLNCLMGYSFGVSDSSLPATLTIFGGYFLAGFVCGMAAYGLVGVVAFVRGLAGNAPLDYRDPDRCGGTSFIGEALVKFSLANLIVGVLISLYIVFAPWTNRGHDHYIVRGLMWVWIVFPFAVAIAHLLLPGYALHVALLRYQKIMHRTLASRVQATREKMEKAQENTRLLREELEYDLKLLADVYRMRTWPISGSSMVHFLATFALHFVPGCFEALKLLKENFIHQA